MTLRAFIVDHESASRKAIRSMLTNQPDFEVVGEYAEGRSAAEAIERQRPDVVFVDLDAPGVNGFAMLQRMSQRPMPKIVVTTASKDYALRAIEAQALDYVLKPFNPDRLQRSVMKAREQLRAERAVGMNQPAPVTATVPSSGDRLAFKSKGVIKFVAVQDIQWVEAQGNYMRISFRGETHLIRETMANMVARLENAQFIRIHRSRLVNLRFIREIQAWSGNRQSLVVMQDGAEFPLSRGCRKHVRHLIK
jgi:two-component system, LytTR family, response regulator